MYVREEHYSICGNAKLKKNIIMANVHSTEMFVKY